MAPVGAPTLDEFSLGDERVRVIDGCLRTADGRLAGSLLDMGQTVRNCVVHAGIPLEEALAMAAAYPADFLGLAESRGGSHRWLRADLVWLDDELGVRAPGSAGSAATRRRCSRARCASASTSAAPSSPPSAWTTADRSARVVRRPVPKSFEGVVDAVAELVTELASAGVRARSVGVSLPGVITRDGEISMIVNLPWLEGRPAAPGPWRRGSVAPWRLPTTPTASPSPKPPTAPPQAPSGVRRDPRHRRGRRSGGAG